uniref:CSON012699 protein n=1 Tax=Culicoides sonorensis TaxID=179676 RepID=A0A336MI93_CULSO
MAVPPPPPPGPPPPPALGNLNLGGGSNAGQARNQLLADITKGKKLKKTVTVDKSAPLISGKVANSSSNSTSHAHSGSQTLSRQNNNSSNVSMSNGPKLGGIFEGMATMPRLKPVGSRTGAKSNPHIDNPTSHQPTTPTRQPAPISNGSVGLDFGSELANRLKSRNKPVTTDNLQVNRGPPPQPPISKEIDQSNETRSNLPVIGPKRGQSVQSASASSSPTPLNGKASPQLVIPNNTGMSLLPNKSTLFSSSTGTPQPQVSPQSPSFSINSNSSHLSNSSSSSPAPPPLPLSSTKPVINHGKPNLAPKPPGMVPNVGNGTRPIVARHQSMRSPRSPPIMGGDGNPVFPSNANKFGTVRMKPFTSTEQINQQFSYPIRPAEPPPKPPGLGGESIQPPSRNNVAITNAQSETHLAILHQISPNHRQPQFEDPPPLPPHRNPPAPPKQAPVINKPAAPVAVPPPPPTRTTSRPSAPNPTTSISRIVSDLETKFAGRFHTVNEFPAPPPFQNTYKTYPSQISSKQVAKG